ncbi:MAG: DUF202 domain-containing protein [Acidimicrobiia bacterium]|nr:DUF202 domain-containing protein [Acidimicrobiia bacterium]
MGEALAADDDGLAPERTALAWNRTGMAFLVAIAAVGRRLWPLDQGNHTIILWVLAGAALAFLGSLWSASRLRTHARYQGDTLDPHAYRLVTLGTLTLAVAGIVFAFFPEN